MPKYLRITDKMIETVADDPKRLIWYGPCGYWTDDWDKLSPTAIPCCPHCNTPGYEVEAGEWWENAKVHEKIHPKYVKFLNVVKERCLSSISIVQYYEDWLEEQKT
jgi:hypothetical protein